METKFQLPPDTNFEDIMPQTNEVAEKIEKVAFDSRNYLDFTIPEGQKSREITIRLLPVNLETKEFFQIVHLHNINVNKELNPNKSGKKAYMCLGHKNTGIDHETFGSKCPICEAQQEIWNQWHEETDVNKKKELQKAAAALNIREYCIVRCIERGKEQDGPKFWRIPLRQDATDAFHKIINIGETRRKEGLEAGVDINIYSLYSGRDLIVTFTDGTGAPSVVDKGISTPITKDNELLSKWYYDEKKWTDVFSAKPYDYLKIAYEGEVPWYDKNNKKWVTKTEFEKNKSNVETSANDEIQKAEEFFKEETPISNPMVEEKPTINTQYTPPTLDDDLPF
jgi:hypothetical protein